MGKREPIPNNLIAIMMAFLDAGIRTFNEDEDGGRGVRFTRREGEVVDAYTAVALKALRESMREAMLKGR